MPKNAESAEREKREIYHILIKEGTEDLGVSMRRIGASYVNYHGTRTASISTTIRGATDEQCIAYGFGSNEEGEQEMTPFLSFAEE